MNVYQSKTIKESIAGNPYVGRGIVLGKTTDGRAVAAYFIMGRSNNSRNRIFAERDGAVFTQPFDASKVEDPSLIIYAAIRRLPHTEYPKTRDKSKCRLHRRGRQYTVFAHR